MFKRSQTTRTFIRWTYTLIIIIVICYTMILLQELNSASPVSIEMDSSGGTQVTPPIIPDSPITPFLHEKPNEGQTL